MAGQSVSVLTAVMNRGDQLLKSLPSWLAFDEISEIIVVDWSSTEPVKELLEGFSSTKIHVIRIDGKTSWHLTGAFNAGLRHVTTSQVLKLDADHLLRKNFFSRNTLAEHAFISGDWRATPPGQSGLNGFLWAWAEDLFSVGGWDERIQGYGWDDSDLTNRLQAVGLFKSDVVISSVKHLHHPAKARSSNQTHSAPLPPGLQTQINRIRTEKRAPWLRSNFVASSHTPVYGKRPDESDLDAWIKARIEVSDDWKPVATVMRRWRQMLVIPLVYRFGFLVSSASRGRRPRKTIVVHVKHGLGNRLRALASAALIAKWEGARLIVGWIPDDHCGADLLDLFDYRGAVISSEEELGNIARDRRTAVINLMDDASPNHKAKIFRLKRRATFVRTSSAIRHPAASPRKIGRTMASWPSSPEVSRLVEAIGSGFDLAIHVRQGNYRGTLTPSFERPQGNWSVPAEERLRAARAETRAENFHERLRPLINIGVASKDIRVFLCADSLDAESNIKAFLFDYGVEHIAVGGNGADRSREAVVRAVADCIVLASATDFVGSSYSAFTDYVHALRDEVEDSSRKSRILRASGQRIQKRLRHFVRNESAPSGQSSNQQPEPSRAPAASVAD